MNSIDLSSPSALVGVIAYSALFVGLVVDRARFASPGWLAIGALTSAAFFASDYLAVASPIVNALEHVMHGSWAMILLGVTGLSAKTATDPVYRTRAVLGALVCAATVVAVIVTLSAVPLVFTWTADLVVCLLGLVIAEQVARNTRYDHRWKLRFLTIGVSVIFIWGIFIHADALMFNRLDVGYLMAQPLIAAVAAPLVYVAVRRSRGSELKLSISRRFIFRTGVLAISGGYLIVLGIAGYLVQLLDTTWSNVAAATVGALGVIAFLVASGSGQVRNYLRVLLARNLFSAKHDYLDEWSRATDALTRPDPDITIGRRAIHTLADAVYAAAGGLWIVSEAGVLVPVERIHSPFVHPMSPRLSRALIDFFETREWVVDIDECEADPQAYQGLDVDGIRDVMEDPRLVVPLMIGDGLYGVVVLRGPQVPLQLVWEDYNLLRVVARQAAAFLALQRAEHALMENKELNVFSRLSAFVVHDLKTVTSQLSLMLDNAGRHRDNPAFIEDMLKTTDNAVGRMNRLLRELETQRESEAARIDLGVMLAECEERFRDRLPRPAFRNLTVAPAWVHGDAHQLSANIGHIVQNAIEATPEDGSVVVTLDVADPWVTVTVTDSGAGMTADFVEQRLFMPFETTKGLSGMGIGVYQAREYIRSIGGDVGVVSQLDQGTTFTIRMPLHGLGDDGDAGGRNGP